ncbi:unnamed protein product, partial [Candidula unifasciata]
MMFHISFTEVYTSSRKIQDMVLQEQQILNNLQAAVTELRNETALLLFSKFYRDRVFKVEKRRYATNPRETLSHPNGIYFYIKHFATDYENIRSVLEHAQSWSVRKYLSSVADQADVRGALRSFLRLQTVYNLSTSDMIRGNYFGRLGPELGQEDVMEIGRAALDSGRVERAIEWLEAALQLVDNKEPTVGFHLFESGTSLTGQIQALLGRAYNHQGDRQKATEMYKMAVSLDPQNVQVKQLERELEFRPPLAVDPSTQRPFKEELGRLCKLQNKLTKNKFDRRLNCTYRQVLLPYYRFKMELISVTPYVALFFDVITDEEINGLTNYATDKLKRGVVLAGRESIFVESRTSDTYFVTNEESPIADRLSKRTGAILGLEAAHDKQDSFLSSDPFQVVNYGMGGHYDVHLDSVNK